MSWNFTQSPFDWSYPSSSSGQTLIPGSNLTSGSLLVGLITAFTGTPTISYLSDTVNGQWNYVDNTLGGYGNISAYWVVNASGGKPNVSWSGGTLTFPGFTFAEFTGNAASPLDTSAKTSSGSSVSCPVNFANDLVVGCPCPSTGGAMEAGAGWISTQPSDTSGGPIIFKTNQSAAASPTFTGSGGIIAISFKIATIAAALNLRMLMGMGK